MYHIIYILYVYSTYYNIGSCLFPPSLCRVRLGSLVLYAFTCYDTSCLYIYEINNILWLFGNMCAIWFPTFYFNNVRVCVCVSAAWCNVTYSEHIVHYTTNNNHTGQSTSHWRLYLSSDKFGLETTENRFVRHKALAERIGRANVRGFGAGNENGVKLRVPLFSENIYI